MFNLMKKDKERDSGRKEKKKERMSAAELRSLEEMSMRRGFFNLKREAKRDSKNKIEISNPIPIKVASGSELTLTDIESDGLSNRSNRSSVVLDGQLSGASSTDDLKGESSHDQHRGSVRDRVAHFGSIAKTNSSQVGQMMKRFSFSQRSKEESPSEGSTPSGPNSAAPSPQVESKVFNMLRKHSVKQSPGAPPPDPPTKRPCVPELVLKTFPAHLHLPPVVAPTAPESRELELQRRNTGDFGFSLRRTTMLDRSPDGGVYRRVVHFAEPGAGTKDLALGLVPGDRLVEINGRNVENKSRDEIVEMIRQSGDTVRLKVQPILELSELSRCWLRNTEGLRRDATHEMHLLPRPVSNTANIWIGLNADPSNQNWAESYPRPDECTVIRGDGKWRTRSCSDKIFSVCENASGFYFMQYSRSWLQARAICKNKYRDLATIQSAEDNQEVYSLLQPYTQGSANPADFMVWIHSHPGWDWSDHDSVFFTNWLSGHPLSFAYASCAVVDPNYHWTDVNCGLKHTAFCYQTVKSSTLVKVSMRSTLDVLDPENYKLITQKIQELLQQNGLEGVAVKPNGPPKKTAETGSHSDPENCP